MNPVKASIHDRMTWVPGMHRRHGWISPQMAEPWQQDRFLETRMLGECGDDWTGDSEVIELSIYLLWSWSIIGPPVSPAIGLC